MADRRAVVVGAGLAGLSAAMHLAGAGRSVTVLEREDFVGGRAARVERRGRSGVRYRLDTGPTVLTMPGLVTDAFAAVGEERDDWLTLHRLDPAYRAHFADGSHLDLTADTAGMEERIRDFAGSDDAAGYRRYVEWVTRLYRAEIDDFIGRNFDSPADLLGRSLAHVVTLKGFARLGPSVQDYFADPRLHRVFGFQAMYAGLSPQQALALYAVISYMDLVEGVFYPEGGMNALPSAMAAAAVSAGVDVVLGSAATGVHWAGDRVDEVRTAERAWPCEELVVTLDAPAALRLLGRDERARQAEALVYSPSCVVLAAGLREPWPDAPEVHHSVHFGRAWDGVFEDLATGRLMRDPSWLLSVPSVTTRSVVPDGGHSAYLLFPAPNLRSGPDWAAVREPYREHMLRTVERAGHAGFVGAVDAEVLITPPDWARRGFAAGTPFAAAHTFRQTGPFRTSNVVADNVVLAGSSTVPGVGVPMVLISGRLAAQRLTGRAKGTRPRARREPASGRR